MKTSGRMLTWTPKTLKTCYLAVVAQTCGVRAKRSWYDIFRPSLGKGCFAYPYIGIFCPKLGMKVMDIIIEVMFVDLFTIRIYKVIFPWHNSRVVSPLFKCNNCPSQFLSFFWKAYCYTSSNSISKRWSCVDITSNDNSNG